MTDHQTKCYQCGNAVKEYIPEFCCNGSDCCCRGLPIHPPICSNKCWTNLLNRGRNEKDKIAHNKDWGFGK
jgi:hypothetical protein